MWNPTQPHRDDDDDSWEIRAFAEDTSNIMGTTWPPRFYSCTFCGRKFKSAQALGGHMNVHRRDRVRFHHQTQRRPNSTQPCISSFPIPPTDVIYNGGGVCFFYQLPNDNLEFLNSVASSACVLSPSTTPTASSVPSLKSSGETRGTASASSSHCSHISIEDGDEKIDLELRLGQRQSPA